MSEASDLYIAALYYVTRQLTAALNEFLGVPAALPSEQEPLHRRAVLRDVLQTPGFTVGQITKRLKIAQSLVSATVTWGCARMVLCTSTDPADRRRTLLFPTEKLGGQFGKVPPQPAWAFRDPLLGHLGPADRAGFERVLGRLREHFKAAQSNGRTHAGIF